MMTFWERVKWDVRRIYFQAKKVVLRSKIGERWVEDESGLVRREYPDYETYVEHQRTKYSAFRSKSILRHDERFFAALTERLAAAPLELSGRSVLCLGARQGTEVRAFVDQGAFAVGIDLNPGPANPYVLPGDFHELQFADASVDCVYTNSLDHAFELGGVLSEVRRVLAPRGTFIVEANLDGADTGANQGPYEALAWAAPEAFLEQLEAHGFRPEHRSSFEIPWPGEQLVLSS